MSLELLSDDVLQYVMSYVDNKTLLSICTISHEFNEFSARNLLLLLRESLQRVSRLNLKRYDIKQLVKLSNISSVNKNISVGLRYSLILTNNGLIYGYGRLGNNIPILLNPLTSIVQTSSGAEHSLIVGNDGKLYVFGQNAFGQLGLGDYLTRYEPTLFQELINIVHLSAGGYYSLILTIDGQIYVFGDNMYGQLGLGNNKSQNIPILLQDLTNIVQVSAGGQHSLILTIDNEIYSFGSNGNGQLGLGDTNGRCKPTLVPHIANIVQISAGGIHSLMLTNHGTIYACGYNYDGQLGLGDNNNNRNIFTLVSNVISITQISAGLYHSLAITISGQVYSWGHNGTGQLGLGDYEYRNKKHQTIHEFIEVHQSDEYVN